MKTYGGENPESPRMKIYGGDKSETKGDALNKLEIPLNKMRVGECPRQDESGGMPQTK